MDGIREPRWGGGAKILSLDQCVGEAFGIKKKIEAFGPLMKKQIQKRIKWSESSLVEILIQTYKYIYVCIGKY